MACMKSLLIAQRENNEANVSTKHFHFQWINKKTSGYRLSNYWLLFNIRACGQWEDLLPIFLPAKILSPLKVRKKEKKPNWHNNEHLNQSFLGVVPAYLDAVSYKLTAELVPFNFSHDDFASCFRASSKFLVLKRNFLWFNPDALPLNHKEGERQSLKANRQGSRLAMGSRLWTRNSCTGAAFEIL